MALKGSTQPKFLGSLIRTAYLPREVPPAITARYFSKFCVENYKYLKNKEKDLLRLSTNYDTFTAPKTVPGRRNFAIVHPLGQLVLSLLITQHRVAIRKIITRHKTSLYETQESPEEGKAYRGFFILPTLIHFHGLF